MNACCSGCCCRTSSRWREDSFVRVPWIMQLTSRLHSCGTFPLQGKEGQPWVGIPTNPAEMLMVKCTAQYIKFGWMTGKTLTFSDMVTSDPDGRTRYPTPAMDVAIDAFDFYSTFVNPPQQVYWDLFTHRT